jgi:hypothetical protein
MRSYIVQYHPDRVSVSFIDEEGPDVECIVTVTLDRRLVDHRLVEGQDNVSIAMLARTRLIEFVRTEEV